MKNGDSLLSRLGLFAEVSAALFGLYFSFCAIDNYLYARRLSEMQVVKRPRAFELSDV